MTEGVDESRPGLRPVVGVELSWVPLGAGPRGGLVRLSGRGYEALRAWRDRRPRAALYHSALVVEVAGDRYFIEMAPVWSVRVPDRGVVAGGPVGHPWLGRSKLFRYEIRRWRDGMIPDLAYAVGGPTGSAPTPRPRGCCWTWCRSSRRRRGGWTSSGSARCGTPTR